MQENLNILWAECQQILKDNLSQSAYQTWFASIEPIQWENNMLVLQARSQFIVDYIEDNYLDILSRVLRKVFGAQVQLEYRILMAGSSIDIPSDSMKLSATPKTTIMPPANVEVDNEWDSHLNPQYTFDNFIVGSSNKFAHAASQAVADKPAVLYNPLFIYGGSGLGKTHLLCAICKEIQKKNPRARILYTKGETMTNELIEAIHNGTTAEYRAKYRQVDVLLVDDIQFIGGKVAIQEEFFHTFDHLHTSGKQIVLTSDNADKYMAMMDVVKVLQEDHAGA